MGHKAAKVLSSTRLLSMLFLCTLAALSYAAEPIIGHASVIDGDTLGFGKQRVRLTGLTHRSVPDLPGQCHRDYRCGKAAADALDEWLARSRPTR
jgi:succinoglycan biosynthesis protein ExoI